MKFNRIFYRDNREYGIDDVIEHGLINRDGGAAESAGYTAEATARAVALVFLRLYEAGILTKEDVMRFRGYEYDEVVGD